MVNEADKELRKMRFRGNIGSSLTLLISLFIFMEAVGKKEVLISHNLSNYNDFHIAPEKVSGCTIRKKSSKDEYNSS